MIQMFGKNTPRNTFIYLSVLEALGIPRDNCRSVPAVIAEGPGIHVIHSLIK